MKIERNKDDKAEENSRVSTNQNLENFKRKLEYHGVSTESILSCSKKLKTAESMYDYTSSAVPSATRYLLDALDKPFFSGVMIEPEENSGVSTELKLFDETWVASNIPVVDLDLWKIKKKLTATDSCISEARLLVPSGSVKEHILPLIGETEEQIHKGIDVRVWDFDTSTLHNMNFGRWKSNSYVLKGRWVKDFVKRRELKENDTIGLYWNDAESRFHFSVLERAAA